MLGRVRVSYMDLSQIRDDIIDGIFIKLCKIADCISALPTIPYLSNNTCIIHVYYDMMRKVYSFLTVKSVRSSRHTYITFLSDSIDLHSRNTIDYIINNI